MSQDTSALEHTVEQDISNGRTPVMVIAYAGTPLSGHVEDMTAIREICNKHKLWMHVQGYAAPPCCCCLIYMYCVQQCTCFTLPSC